MKQRKKSDVWWIKRNGKVRRKGLIRQNKISESVPETSWFGTSAAKSWSVPNPIQSLVLNRGICRVRTSKIDLFCFCWPMTFRPSFWFWFFELILHSHLAGLFIYLFIYLFYLLIYFLMCDIFDLSFFILFEKWGANIYIFTERYHQFIF